jgi:hypothetical protein
LSGIEPSKSNDDDFSEYFDDWKIHYLIFL